MATCATMNGNEETMSKIAILTDSSCDIPQELAEKYGIDIMGFHILLDDVDYVERESCTNIEFYDKMRAAKGRQVGSCRICQDEYRSEKFYNSF